MRSPQHVELGLHIELPEQAQRRDVLLVFAFVEVLGPQEKPDQHREQDRGRERDAGDPSGWLHGGVPRSPVSVFRNATIAFVSAGVAVRPS